VTRNDDERIADILEAGATLAAIVAGANPSGTTTGSAGLPPNGSSRSSANPPER